MVGRTKTARAEIGIIGGSGLYDIEGLRQVKRVTLTTPFGTPSSPVVVGELDGIRVAFLSRHGQGHRFNPSEINYRANIYALKAIGVRRVISVSAVGSMKEAIKPGHVVLPDQFIDLTKRRISTFFEGGVVAHVAFNEPVCASLGDSLLGAGRSVGATIHQGGTYVCISTSCAFPIQQIKLPVINSVSGLQPEEFFLRGSIVEAAGKFSCRLLSNSIASTLGSPLIRSKSMSIISSSTVTWKLL